MAQNSPIRTPHLELENHLQWVEFDSILPDDSNALYSILKFFIVESPSGDSTVRGNPLTQWKIYNKQLIEVLSNNGKILLINCSVKNLYKELKDNQLLTEDNTPNNTNQERAVYSGDTISTDLFRHIRNSLSHGRFEIEEKGEYKMYYFEDRVNNDPASELRARIIIRETSLLTWIIKLTGNPEVKNKK